MTIVSGAPIPVTPSTEPPIAQAALRVAVVTGGAVRSGPALPVYVISAAQAAAGYAIQSNTPVPVQAATGVPVAGQRPIPVYVVSGSLSAAQTYTEKVLATRPANLLAYWPLNESSGTTAINAQGVAARNGTYKAAGEPLLGQPGPHSPRTAPLFDGVNDYCNIYSASLAAAFNGLEGTLVAWVKVSTVGIWTDGTQRWAVTLSIADGTNRVILNKQAGNNSLAVIYTAGGVGKSVVPTGQTSTGWIYLACTWSKSAGASGELKLYLNGAQTGTTQTGLGTFAGALSSTQTVIGAQTSAGALPWSGLLSDVALWSTPLTAAEVAALATG